jgi:hypothetical protein
MTMPTGLLAWGQAGQYNGIDDRSAIAALYGSGSGLGGLVSPPTLTAGSGLAVTMGPWLAVVDCGDGTRAVIGSRASATFNETAGGASARADVLWADISPDNATWTLSLITEAAMAGRTGVFLGLILVPASASTSAAMDLRPGNERTLGPWGKAQFPSLTSGGTGFATIASMVVPAYDSDVGAVYEIEAWGNGTITQAGKSALTLRLQTGATVLQTVGFGAGCFGGSNAFRWWAVARLIVVALGTSGTVRSFIKANVSEYNQNISAASGNFGEVTSSESSGTSAKDSTRDATLALQASWGQSGQAITCQVMIPKRIA